MIIVRELGDGCVEVSSSIGKVDIGNGPVEKIIAHVDEVEYITESEDLPEPEEQTEPEEQEEQAEPEEQEEPEEEDESNEDELESTIQE